MKQLLPRYAVRQRLGVETDATLRQYVADGIAAPPVQGGHGTEVWLSYEVDAVVVARAAGADDDAVRKLVADLVAARPSLPVLQLALATVAGAA